MNNIQIQDNKTKYKVKPKKRKATQAEILAYYDAWRGVFRNKELKRSDLVVLYFLKDSNFEDVFKFQQTLAKDTGHSRQSVNYSLKHLKELGIIKVFKQKDQRKPLTINLIPSLLDPTKEWSHLSNVVDSSCQTDLTAAVKQTLQRQAPINDNQINENKLTFSDAKKRETSIVNSKTPVAHPITSSNILISPLSEPIVTYSLTPQEGAELQQEFPTLTKQDLKNKWGYVANGKQSFKTREEFIKGIKRAIYGQPTREDQRHGGIYEG